jgi:hypothetical protein
MQTLNRQETEDFILDLYYNQKKTFREIQKIIRKSPRDLKKIIDKANPDKSSSLSVYSQAYRMFKEGNHPIDVATSLNLRQREVSEIYREYWDLNGMYYLNQIYGETKDEIWSVIEFYKQMKAAGKNTAHAIRLLEFANNDAPAVEGKITELERKEATLNIRIQRAAKIFQEFNDSILNEQKTLEQYRSEIRQAKRELAHLYVEKIKLENSMDYFHNNNEAYLKIKRIIKQEIEYIMANSVRQLLRFALASIFESSRRHPGKLQSLYYNMSTAEIQSLLRTSIGQNDHNPSQDGNNENTPEKILLDEAEQVFNRFIDNITGKSIKITNDTKSISQTEKVTGLRYDMSQEEDYHTSHDFCKVEIPASKVSSNFTMRICESETPPRSS